MAFSDIVTIRYEGSSVLGYSQTLTGGQRVEVDEAIPANQTNLQVAFVAAMAKIQSFLIVSVGGALTVKTNSTSAPDRTWSLVDGEPLIWTTKFSNQTYTAFFVANIATLYVTNTTATQLIIRSLVDPT